ncbi:MAG: excinuclease ABC subunit UvrC, partial [Bacteroidales bacterium]|nr:excinuclease ABC subunit UvrC [Bacteroidales bacterium]
MREELKILAQILPETPGVYQFFDKEGTLIYVGKAKNLKKRVLSYFAKKITGKTKVMTGKVADIRHIVVETESEALLLENSLIKKHQPRYNVLMKDDKTFPWICVKNEPFPRVFMIRNVIHDGSVYYGPYTSVVMVRTLLELIRQLYRLRTCSYNLSEEKISEGHYKVCLEYHIGNCKGACIGNEKEKDYNKSIAEINDILKGNIYTVTSHLKSLMNKYSRETRFEEAQVVKDKLEILEKYRSRSTVVNPRIKDVDVFGYTEDGIKAYVNFLKVIRGAVVQSHAIEFKKKMDESKEEIISLAITELRQRHESNAKEVLLSLRPDIQHDNIKYTVPVKGDKLRLVELAERNAVHYRMNQKRRLAEHKPVNKTRAHLENLKKDLRLPELPVHIECFDNSNIQGSSPVAACVVFRNGRPAKREYRHYNIKSVTGSDDFASMEEIVFRRYRRLMDEDESLPQLIIIDGGKGQLRSAVKSLETLSLLKRITVIGIAKKLEEIYFPGDSVPLYINKNSMSLKIIQQLRNEAHRFSINFHRDQRSRKMVNSVLDEIPGIGVKTKEILLRHFGSV